jgi:membrane protein
VILAVWRGLTREEAAVLAGGIAFYGFLALLPGLLAVIVLYGMWADPRDVKQQLAFLGRLLPPGAVESLREELARMAAARSGQSLGLHAVVGLLVALWSASRGIKGMLRALGPSDEPIVSVNRARRAVLALVLSAGGLLVTVVALTAVAAVPSLLLRLGLSHTGASIVRVARWPTFAVLVFAWLALLYRHGPNGPALPWRQVAPGAAAATLVWLGGSAAFSAYVARFGQQDVYGSLAGAVALLTWMLLAAYAVLLGVEVNRSLAGES